MDSLEKPEVAESKEVVFWSRAKSCRLANFKEEKRDGGRVTQPESSIRFYENIYVTSNPEEIDFIRHHTAFANGDVRECASMQEARKLTAQKEAVKYATGEERASFVESTLISDTGETPIKGR